jgi:hypothetical protein
MVWYSVLKNAARGTDLGGAAAGRLAKGKWVVKLQEGVPCEDVDGTQSAAEQAAQGRKWAGGHGHRAGGQQTRLVMREAPHTRIATRRAGGASTVCTEQYALPGSQ